MNLPRVDYSGNATCALLYVINLIGLIYYPFQFLSFIFMKYNFFYLKSFTVETAIYYNDPLITCITSDPLTKRYDTD